MTKEMTVGDLIDELQRYPRTLRVLVDSYETGFSDPIVTKDMVVPLAAPFEWEGKYASFREGGGAVGGFFNAVVIGRDKSGG